MSILVTGGAGYIGSHMVLRLLDAGEKVVILDNLSTGHEWLLPGKAAFCEGDISDQGLVTTTIKNHSVDTIIHFAGSIVVPDSVSDPISYYHNNTVKSHALMAAAVESGIERFIFSSTAAVYGEPEVVPIREDARLNPDSPYGSSKWMSEVMLQDIARASEMKFGILRYFNVAGADPQGRSGQSSKASTHLIKVACEAALGKRDGMKIFGDDYDTHDGTCVRDYIHVSDLVSAHAQLLHYMRNTDSSLIANCGYGRGFSVKEVISTVEKVAGKKINVEMAGRRPGDPAQIVANSDQAKTLLDWIPQYEDLSVIIQHALDWEERLAKRNADD